MAFQIDQLLTSSVSGALRVGNIIAGTGEAKWAGALVDYESERDNKRAAIFKSNAVKDMKAHGLADDFVLAQLDRSDAKRAAFVQKVDLLNTDPAFTEQQRSLGFTDEQIGGQLQARIQNQIEAQQNESAERAAELRRANPGQLGSAINQLNDPKSKQSAGAVALRGELENLGIIGVAKPVSKPVGAEPPVKQIPEPAESPTSTPEEQLFTPAPVTGNTPTSKEVAAKASLDINQSFIGETPTDEEILRQRRLRQGKRP